MSKSSIFESAWLNLVFEGKNKAYGAYQLRQESPRTTLYAFALGLFFVAAVASIGLFLSSFGNKPTMNNVPVINDTLRVTKWENFEPPVAPALPRVPKKSEPVSEVPDASDMTQNPTIVSADQADNVTRNTDPPASPNGQTGNGEGTSTTTGISTIAPDTTPDSDTPSPLTVLDKMPEFPGGINGFYKYVGDNFEKPEIDHTVTVLISFVIEKDGSITDIKVLRNPGYGLDKEAIRVLKSLKTKWKPGIKSGQPVRVLYQLPIKITQG